jgi:CheY-like chemotaxis protein
LRNILNIISSISKTFIHTFDKILYMMKLSEAFQTLNSMPIRVLHVDNDPAHLVITKIFLNRGAKGDFEIVSVLSVEEALEKLEGEDFDVVVSDCKMPGMDGLVFLDAMRRSRNYEGIPFILFSGDVGPDVLKEALKKGAERYITKKGDPSTQCSALARAIYELALEKRKKEASHMAVILPHRIPSTET